MAAAAVGAAGDGLGQALPAGRQTLGTRPLGYDGALVVVRRQRVRRPVIASYDEQPARAVLAAWMRAEQNHLGLTQEQYADQYGVSRSSVSRFWSGEGKLTALLRLHLKARHPDWARTVDAVVLEDAQRAEAREARRAAG